LPSKQIIPSSYRTIGKHMFYIVVIDKDTDRVVVDASGRSREFKKEKKARNFINGRLSLRMKETKIVSDLTDIYESITVDI